MPAVLAIRATTINVASIDRLARDRSQQQRPGGPLAPAYLQHPHDRDRQRHRGGLVALADQVKHPVATESVGVVLDLHRGRFEGA